MGFLSLFGKCEKCGERISWKYPLSEILNAIFISLIYLKTGWGLEFIYFGCIFEALLLIAVLDFQTHSIFPQPVIVCLCFQSIWLLGPGRAELLDSFLGLFIGAGIFHWVSYLYQVVRKRVGLGDGDATLLGLIGYVFGWNALFRVIFWGAALGILGGSLTQLVKRQSITQEIAFAPWMILAVFLTWYFPDFFRSIPFDFSRGIRLF